MNTSTFRTDRLILRKFIKDDVVSIKNDGRFPSIFAENRKS